MLHFHSQASTGTKPTLCFQFQVLKPVHTLSLAAIIGTRAIQVCSKMMHLGHLLWLCAASWRAAAAIGISGTAFLSCLPPLIFVKVMNEFPHFILHSAHVCVCVFQPPQSHCFPGEGSVCWSRLSAATLTSHRWPPGGLGGRVGRRGGGTRSLKPKIAGC